MRGIVIAAVAALVSLAVGSVAPHRAEAMTVTTPAGIRAAIKETNLLHDIACRRMWRCGPWGCGWRPVCWNDWGDPYSYGLSNPYYYVYEGPYGYGYLYVVPQYYSNAPYQGGRYYPPY